MEKLEFVLQAKDEFTNQLDSITGKLPSLATLAAGAGAAVAAAGAAMWTMTKGAADAYDAVNDLSNRLGITTEFISQMNHAAQMNGVTTQEMGVSLKMLSVKLGEASAGAGPAADAFDALGVKVRDSNGHIKSAEQIMPELADAFSKLGSASERAALAQDIFGRQGTALIPILSGGSAGLAELNAEAEKFGLVISTQAADNAAEMNDAIDRMKGSATGLRNSFAEELFPIFSSGFNSMANLVANNREKITQWAEVAVYGFSKAAEVVVIFGGVVADVFRAAHAVWEGVKTSIAGIGEAISQTLSWAAEKVANFLDKINFGGMWDTEIAGLRRFEGAFSMMGDSLGGVAKDSAAEVQAYWDGGMGKATESVKGFVEEFKKGMAETQAPIGGSEEGGGIEGVMGSSEKHEKEREEYQNHYNELLSINEQYTLTEEQRLTAWYEREKAIFAGHREASILLDQTYNARVDKMRTERTERINKEWEATVLSDQKKLDLWYKRQQEMFQGNADALTKIDEIYMKKKKEVQEKHDAETVRTREEVYKNLETIGTAFGKRGVLIAKALAIPEAIINTYKGAAKALELGWPMGTIAAAAVMAQGFGYVASIRSQAVNIAHGGINNVPREETYLLDRGERVLSPRQNEDLTQFIKGGSGFSSGIRVDEFHLHVFENATNADTMLQLGTDDWRYIVEDRIFPALISLKGEGKSA